MSASGASDPLHRLHLSASRTHGVISTIAARQLGVTWSQIRTARDRGVWTSPTRGVLVATASTATWEQRLMIAVTAAGGVASHRAAARVHRLDGFADAPVELSVPRPRRPRAGPSSVVHQTTPLEDLDVTEVNGIPVTSIARTLVDLGAVVADDEVEKALDDALRRGVSLRWITRTLERLDRPGPSGVQSLVRILQRKDRQGPIPASAFERLVERQVTAAGLPRPDRQFEVLDGEGTLIARVDAAWPEARLALESHSARWHTGSRRERGDRRRHSRLIAVGWEVMYVSWWDVEHPDEFLAELRSALRLRSEASSRT